MSCSFLGNLTFDGATPLLDSVTFLGYSVTKLRYSDTFLVTTPPKSNYDLFLLGVVNDLHLVIQFTSTKETAANA